MPTPLVLYSAITRLAYNLGQRYYGEVHYVWCAPRTTADPHAFKNPPSSDPFVIYWRCRDDVDSGDTHSAYIEQNRRGLIQGASVKEQKGVIDAHRQKLIEGIVKAAPIDMFSPLLLVIPYEQVKGIVKAAALANLATATSEEYIIEELPRTHFDVIELRR